MTKILSRIESQVLLNPQSGAGSHFSIEIELNINLLNNQPEPHSGDTNFAGNMVLAPEIVFLTDEKRLVTRAFYGDMLQIATPQEGKRVRRSSYSIYNAPDTEAPMPPSTNTTSRCGYFLPA